jgi:hypothetical protein
MNGNSKPLSFADAYGLGLIAKNPGGDDWSVILANLSDNAREIAQAMLNDSGSREAKSTAKDLLTFADKVSSDQPT